MSELAEKTYKDSIPTLKDAIEHDTVEKVLALDVDQYKYGFVTEIESDTAPKGLSEDTIRMISGKKNEPQWMLDWRLEAYKRWLTMTEPVWAKVHYPKIDFQNMHFYSAPKGTTGPKTLADVDPALIAMYDKLGVPLREREILAGVQNPRVAVDAVIDSVSVVTTFREELSKVGIIFCSISEAIREHSALIQKYMGSVVPVTDNYYATLNSAVFTDGSFVYIPKGVRCPMELSTYFRINERNTGQFERTLIIAEEGSYVSYLEGCTAPTRDEHQLHAAVVELVALDDAEIKYSTVQNWYPGDKDGKGGIYNFVTKRGDCRGDRSKISWTQVETGSAITWKYPSCILRGDGSSGEFYSIAISNGYQQVDLGTKMIHLGKNTTSRIISKGIAAGHSDNTYRGQVSAHAKAKNARNFTQCDSLLIGDRCGAHTVPYIESRNSSAVFEHEATTSKISDDQMFYCQQRGLSEEEAVALIVNGFVRDVLQHLPMEFMVETQKLISISLEGERRLMTPSRRDIINVIDVPTRTIHDGPRFAVALGDIDAALGTTQIGATLHVVPAGKTAWPYHRHHGNDELFFVVAGTGEYRVGERRLPIKTGDLIGAPAGGEAHQIINSSSAELRYIAFANHGRADVIEYPDSGRISVDIAHGNDRDPMSFLSVAGRLEPSGYWDGEDMGEGERSG